MEYVLAFVLGTVVSFAVLMVAVPIAQKIGDFALPPMGERAAMLAAIAAGVNLIDVALRPFSPIVAWVLGVIVFWVLMVKWFQVDFLGAVVIVVITWVVRVVLMGLLLAAFAMAMSV